MYNWKANCGIISAEFMLRINSHKVDQIIKPGICYVLKENCIAVYWKDQKILNQKHTISDTFSRLGPLKSFHSFYFDILFQLLPSVCAYSCISMFRLCEFQSGNSRTFCFLLVLLIARERSRMHSFHTPRAFILPEHTSRTTLGAEELHSSHDGSIFVQTLHQTLQNFLSPPS